MDDRSGKFAVKGVAVLLAMGSCAVVVEEEAATRGGLEIEGVELVATAVVEAKQGEAMEVRV